MEPSKFDKIVSDVAANFGKVVFAAVTSAAVTLVLTIPAEVAPTVNKTQTEMVNFGSLRCIAKKVPQSVYPAMECWSNSKRVAENHLREVSEYTGAGIVDVDVTGTNAKAIMSYGKFTESYFLVLVRPSKANMMDTLLKGM